MNECEWQLAYLDIIFWHFIHIGNLPNIKSDKHSLCHAFKIHNLNPTPPHSAQKLVTMSVLNIAEKGYIFECQRGPRNHGNRGYFKHQSPRNSKKGVFCRFSILARKAWSGACWDENSQCAINMIEHRNNSSIYALWGTPFHDTGLTTHFIVRSNMFCFLFMHV